jgi:hypothetical protein
MKALAFNPSGALLTSSPNISQTEYIKNRAALNRSFAVKKILIIALETRNPKKGTRVGNPFRRLIIALSPTL